MHKEKTSLIIHSIMFDSITEDIICAVIVLYRSFINRQFPRKTNLFVNYYQVGH